MKIKLPKYVPERRLVEDLRAEVKKLQENNTLPYHAVLMNEAANTIEKLIFLKT